MPLPIKKLNPIDENAIKNPPKNNFRSLSLKLFIKKLLVFLIYAPIICTGWITKLGSPINRSKPIEPINIKNKFISTN